MYLIFKGMVYQQIVGIPMGKKLCSTHLNLFLFCYKMDFMSNLHKSKQYDLIDMLNDTSQYLDDIFTIDNPECEKYIPDIYPTELQLNKANTSDKETSFFDLNIKVIGSDVHTIVYDKRDADFLSSISPGWVMFLDSHRMLFTFFSLLYMLGAALAFWVTILKIFN